MEEQATAKGINNQRTGREARLYNSIGKKSRAYKHGSGELHKRITMMIHGKWQKYNNQSTGFTFVVLKTEL